MKRTNLTQQSINFLNVAEVSLTYATKVKPSERPAIKNSHDAHKIFFDSWDTATHQQGKKRNPQACKFHDTGIRICTHLCEGREGQISVSGKR